MARCAIPDACRATMAMGRALEGRPVGYKDDGALCRLDAIIIAKETYTRGVGVVLNTVPKHLMRRSQRPRIRRGLILRTQRFHDNQALPAMIIMTTAIARCL